MPGGVPVGIAPPEPEEEDVHRAGRDQDVLGGNNQYVDVSHYGYYSIGSPSSATVTIPPKPEE